MLSWYLIFGYVFIIKIVESTETNDTTTLLSTEDADKSFLHKTVVNPHNFEYLLNPGRIVCESQNELFLIVYVHTAPSNVKRRLAIRETWSKRSVFKHARLLFMMGYTPGDNLTSLLNYEYDLYGDIVQEDFYDSYRNLTYKGIMAMRWISEYCSNAKYILKVDDDIIVNMFLLWKHLRVLHKYRLVKQRTIMCNLWDGMEVMREADNKWHVSLEEYRAKVYGNYCSGSAIVMTSDLAPLIANMSNYVQFFWVDDYYLSGLVPRFLNVTYQAFNSLYAIFTDDIRGAFKNKKNKTEYTMFGHEPERLNYLYYIWSFIYKQNFYEHLYYRHSSDFRFLNEFKWLDQLN